MKQRILLPVLSKNVLIVIGGLLFLSACDNPNNQLTLSAIETPHTAETIKARVLVETPTMGSLLQLRGVVGDGKLFIKQQDHQCLQVPIKFIAGDFGGSSVAINGMDSVALAIYSDEVLQQLLAGEKIVSKRYQVTHLDGRIQSESVGDMRIESGLASSYGFVLRRKGWRHPLSSADERQLSACYWS